jgi:putative redox protein
MTITVNTLSGNGYRHSIEINHKHKLLTDLPVSLGGEDSAPDPHDYFDAALAACKALTLKLYAEKHGIPLTGVTVEVKHDSSQEREGKYHLHVELTLEGMLSNEQRALLHRIADRCPVHKLMTTTEVSIETHLTEGAVDQ